MSAMDTPADLSKDAARTAARDRPAAPRISWPTLALMTTASVASLRAAPTMAVYGLAPRARVSAVGVQTGFTRLLGDMGGTFAAAVALGAATTWLAQRPGSGV